MYLCVYVNVSSRAAPKLITSNRNTRAAALHDLDLAGDLPEDEDSEDNRVQSDVPHSSLRSPFALPEDKLST